MSRMESHQIQDGFLGQKMIVLPDSLKRHLKENDICRLFYITDIGYYPKAEHHYRNRKKGTKEYIFLYCVEGKGDIKTNGVHTSVAPNTFHIIPRNTPHEYRANADDPWSIYWMHFGGSSADSFYARYLQNHKSSSSIAYEGSRVDKFNEIFTIYESEYTITKLEFTSIHGMHLLCSFIYASKNLTLERNQQAGLVDDVIQFLTSNLDKTLRAEEIARHFYCSPSYLFNLFKQRTGYSPIHFFNLKKIQKACEYLKYTDLSNKEISFRVGFQDPLYFSRTFKKYFGTSPRQYRKEQRE